jgi:hypothetical protein
LGFDGWKVKEHSMIAGVHDPQPLMSPHPAKLATT